MADQSVLVATVNFPFVATENRVSWELLSSITSPHCVLPLAHKRYKYRSNLLQRSSNAISIGPRFGYEAL